ncbi:hypothetical protein SteCoe_22112 [Stentor coeruleus]|uniref:Cell division cycle protein 123 homolog n=1 Tax=Stentor coeruleus TaxID=5963 RepID=A0A1R2BN66_9CILI|nr:hypothetical protein SteCoe_22112 [Stentor coeruleus]
MIGKSTEEWCQDHIWKAHFKGKVFTSISIPLPEIFIRFLDIDSVVVDKNDDDNETQQILHSEEFSTILSQISESISKIGGAGVIPRLNWSCPKDAEWMNSLCCKTSREVLILLKSSVLLASDCELAEKLSLPLILNLVRYHKLREGMLFRCFVKEKVLVAVSQKEVSVCFDYLKDIKSDILRKCEEIARVIIEKCPLDNFCFDIYVDMPPLYRAFIMGFNAFHESSDSLLFSWEEIENLTEKTMRIVDDQTVQASSYSPYRVPLEMTDCKDFSEFINSLPKK